MADAVRPMRVYNQDPDQSVTCRLCNEPRLTRQMTQHLSRRHAGLGISGYVDKYGPESAQDFWVFKRMSKAAQEAAAAEQAPPAAGKAKTLEEELVSSLTAVERQFYDQYSAEIFQQIDRDLAQWPMVMSLTLDQVQLKRLRAQQDADKYKDPKHTQALAFGVKTTEERIRAQMDSLGISRSSKLKNKAQVKTTPFSLVAAYLNEIERMTPQQADALENDERKLLSEVKDRISKLYISVAPELEEEEVEDDALSSLDIENVLAKSGLEI